MGILSKFRYWLSVEKRTSFDNPSVSWLDPEAWRALFGGGGKSAAGVTVGAESASGIPPLWRAISIIATNVAKIPLHTYERSGPSGGFRQEARGHPAYNILRHTPCSFLDAFVFRLIATTNLVIHGNVYIYIWRNRMGAPEELAFLPTLQTYPVLEVDRANGRARMYYVTSVAGEERRLDSSDVIHLRGIGDDLVGWSILDRAVDALGLGIGLIKFSSSFFANNAQPSVLLKFPGKLDDQTVDRLRSSWSKMHSGVGNQFRPAILENGFDVVSLGHTAKDSQQIESRLQNVRDVACLTGVPASMLGDPNGVSYNSLEGYRLQLLENALDPWMVAWEMGSRKLLTVAERESDSHYIEFNRDAFLATDTATRTDAFAKALGGTGGIPWMMINEIRKSLNLPPIDDPRADQLILPLSVSGPDSAGKLIDESDNTPNDDSEDELENDSEDNSDDEDGESERAAKIDARDAVWRNACAWLVRRIAADARRAAGHPETFCRWLDDEYEIKHLAAAEDRLGTLLGLYAIGEVPPVAIDGAAGVLRALQSRLNAVAAGAPSSTLSVALEADIAVWLDVLCGDSED